MDALTTSEVGLGSAALTTALIAWLKNLGLAPSQKVILIWAMVIPILVQVLLVASNTTPLTVQAVAAAVMAGITSGLAAGGLHDHASAAAEKVHTIMAPVPAPVPVSPFSDAVFQRSLDLIDADGSLTPEQKAAAKAALQKFRQDVKPPTL
mgnify:CR=1 FL=1